VQRLRRKKLLWRRVRLRLALEDVMEVWLEIAVL